MRAETELGLRTADPARAEKAMLDHITQSYHRTSAGLHDAEAGRG